MVGYVPNVVFLQNDARDVWHSIEGIVADLFDFVSGQIDHLQADQFAPAKHRPLQARYVRIRNRKQLKREAVSGFEKVERRLSLPDYRTTGYLQMLKAVDNLEYCSVVRLLLHPGRIENAGILEPLQNVFASHKGDPVQTVQRQVMVAVDVDALGGELEEHLLVKVGDVGFVEFQALEDAFHIDRPEHVLQSRIVHLRSKAFQFFCVIVHATWRDHRRLDLVWFDYFDLLTRLWLQIGMLHLVAQNRSGGRLNGRRLVANVQSVEVWLLIVAARKVVRIAEIQILAVHVQDQHKQRFGEDCLFAKFVEDRARLMR